MIVTLEETKLWLRVDGTEEDVLIQTLINTAELYLKGATGITYDSSSELAKLFCFALVSDWYENREYIGKETDRTRFTLQTILMQLTYGGDSVESSTI